MFPTRTMLCAALSALALLPSTAFGDSEVFARGNMFARAENDGRILCGKSDPPSDDPHRMGFKLRKIMEVDSDGNEVSSDHTVSADAFAGASFGVAALNEAVQVEGATATAVSTEITISGGVLPSLSGDAEIKLLVYLFEDEGEVDVNGNKLSVKNGTIKWTLEIRGWDWCEGALDGCSTDGVALLADVEVESSSSDPSVEGEGDASVTYDMGGNGRLTLVTEVEVDGNFHAMDDNGDYPSFSTEGDAETVLHLRFPKGAGDGNVIIYDPNAEYDGDGDDGGDGGNGGNGAMGSQPATVALLTMAVIAVLHLM